MYAPIVFTCGAAYWYTGCVSRSKVLMYVTVQILTFSSILLHFVWLQYEAITTHLFQSLQSYNFVILVLNLIVVLL